MPVPLYLRSGNYMTLLFFPVFTRLECQCDDFYFSARMTEKEDQSDVSHNGILLSRLASA
jgi:hypothetical protein